MSSAMTAITTSNSMSVNAERRRVMELGLRERLQRRYTRVYRNATQNFYSNSFLFGFRSQKGADGPTTIVRMNEGVFNSELAAAAMGQTSQEFVAAQAGRLKVDGLGGKAGALAWYRQFFREGRAFDRVAEPGFPVVSRVCEESAEGEVVKFLTQVGTRATTTQSEEAQARAAVLAGSGTGFGRDVSHRFERLEVESVLIPMLSSTGARTYTLCVSSQVGCAMGCTFCETAQMGLVRSLTANEIVAQWWNATHVIGIRPKNVVFMGMGEPLDNYENVVRAVAVLRDHNGPHVSTSKITISTVGRVEGIRRLGEQVKEPGWHRLGLAFSLNAPNDSVRGEIMPINRKWNLAEVQKALMEWPRYAGNKLCIEYVLIPGVNDSREAAREVASFLKPFGNFESSKKGEQKMLALLNLIPYNPRRNSPWPAPSEESVDAFLKWLHDEGVFAKRRRTKGRETMAACGQLGAAHIRQRKLVPMTVAGQ